MMYYMFYTAFILETGFQLYSLINAAAEWADVGNVE